MKKDDGVSQFVRVSAVARSIGVSTSTLHEWAEQGHVPRIIALSTHIHVFEREAIERWLDEKKQCVA
jgi:predicted DNA-binding transcriptional regulator AlpA